MSRRTPFQWIIDRLTEDENKNVTSMKIISPSLMRITRTNGTTINVTLSHLMAFDAADIESILNLESADFILHTERDPFINGEALDYLARYKIVLGGFKDILSVVNRQATYGHESAEVSFILRGLRQHTKVKSVRRLDSKRYLISRLGVLKDVTIVAVYDYDIAVESVRIALDNYEKFDFIVKGNPNGRITDAAYDVAKTTGIKILTWGDLMRQLNFR